jgi:hypothetical protein
MPVQGLFFALFATCSARLWFRRVPLDNALQCTTMWTFNPTLKSGNVSMVAGRMASLGQGTSVLQWRYNDEVVWCRQFAAQRVVALLWDDASIEVVVFAVALKGEPQEEFGPFALQSGTRLPVLFAARLDTQQQGRFLAEGVVRLGTPGSTTLPLGAMRSVEGELVVHLQSWGHSEECVGPAPLVHSVALLLSGSATLQIGRTCRDWACSTAEHCNFTQREAALEPDFDRHRLRGMQLAMVVAALGCAALTSLWMGCAGG